MSIEQRMCYCAQRGDPGWHNLNDIWYHVPALKPTLVFSSFHKVARSSFWNYWPNHWYRTSRRQQRHKSPQWTCSRVWSLIPSTRSVANIYLPPSNFMTPTTNLQRRDSSSHLKEDQMSSIISANLRTIWTNATTIIYSHPTSQNYCERFLVSTASQLLLQSWTGIHWTLPWHQRSFTSCVFLPLITSTSLSSKFPTGQCPASPEILPWLLCSRRRVLKRKWCVGFSFSILTINRHNRRRNSLVSKFRPLQSMKTPLPSLGNVIVTFGRNASKMPPSFSFHLNFAEWLVLGSETGWKSE